jgi:VWFA-related protein
MRSLRPLTSLVFANLLCAAVAISAQSPQDWPAQQFRAETLTVNVDIVEVYFTVEKDNRFVENLKKEDFILLENDRKERIRYFSAESRASLSLGLLIDTSTSELPMLKHEQEIARRFFETVLLQGDEGLVASFDSQIQLRQDFTGEHGLLVDAIAQSQTDSSHRSPEIDRKPPRGRTTALYDAITGISHYRFAARRGRKAIIIITDGQDIGSRAHAFEAVDAALKANSICYVLLVGDPRNKAWAYKGYERMKYLADETGGRVIRLQQVGNDLERSLSQIAAELRHHYSIGYTPSNRHPGSDYRSISIRTHRGYQVKSRRGYYYTPNQTSASGGE